MTKGASEGKVRIALASLDLEPIVYKPPDDARNWKPCDFMVWWQIAGGGLTSLHSAWVEVKECPNVGSFPLADLRASQRDGIRRAKRLGLPYLLVIWWKARKVWTISDAWALDGAPTRGSVMYSILAGRIGIDAGQDHLAETLRAVLEEGLLDGKAEA